MKILAIDDKESQLAALAEMLRSLIPNCEVLTASSGAAGLELSRTFQPDTIILNVQMPGMDGFQVCQALKADPASRHIPIIFLTGQVTDLASRIRGLEIGGDAFLIHPLNIGDLVSQVRVMGRIKHAEDALRAEKKSLDDQLRESIEQQTSILRIARDAFYISDTQGRLWDVNEAACQMTGYTREELLRMSVSDLDVDESPARIAAQAESIKQAGSARFERRQRCKDGHLIHVELSVNYLPNSGGRLCAFIRDITERKQTEQKLAASEDRYRTLVARSPYCIHEIDRNGCLSSMNSAGLEMMGVRDEAVIRGMPYLSTVATADKERVSRLMVEAFKGRSAEFEFMGATGQYYQSSFVPIGDEPGNVLRLMGLTQDITERKRAEDTNLLQTTALNATANAIVITDRKGQIEWLNPAFTRLTGYSAEETPGKNPRDLVRSGKQDDAFYEDLWGTILSSRVWRGTLVNRRKDGSLYTEEETITPVKDAQGQITHFIAVKEDVTGKKLLEEQIRQSQKMEAVGQLAGGVAHDFNNIIAGMMMQAEMMGMDENLPQEIRDGLQQIHNDAKRAANLTRQLLLFSRKQVMEPQNLDLNEVISSLAKMLQRIIGENVELQLNLHPRPLLARADAGMLDQLLMNLVINARDAMPGGGKIVIESSAKTFTAEEAASNPDFKPGRHIGLRVTDTGSGIAPENLSRIFEPFFTTKEAGKGTGLGLATVFGIVKQHGGTITVESEAGQGTAFQIFLRADAAAVVAETREAIAAAPRSAYASS